jgi:hypothetical protein
MVCALFRMGAAHPDILMAYDLIVCLFVLARRDMIVYGGTPSRLRRLNLHSMLYKDKILSSGVQPRLQIFPIFAADEAKYCDITDPWFYIGFICSETGHH